MSTTSEPTTMPSKFGRQSEYDETSAAKVCELLAEGMSLRQVCEIEGLPHRSTVHRWLATRPEFAAAYARARELGCELIAETALEEALLASPANAQAARLHFDSRRWFIGKISPKKWGDKTAVEHSGPGGTAVQLQPVAPRLVPREIAAGIAALLTASEQAAGIPPGEGTDAERLRAIVDSGRPLHPDLFEALYADRQSDAESA